MVVAELGIKTIREALSRVPVSVAKYRKSSSR